jgi:FkbM family methyltransferase
MLREMPQVRRLEYAKIRRRCQEIDRHFLSASRSIMHVGANYGQERFLYEAFGASVLWIEALPEVFLSLKRNLIGFRNQSALRALVSDKAGEHVQFKVASNSGASSSMFDFALHQELWPEVKMQTTISLETQTIDDLVEPSRDVDALVLDVQGAELKVLQGARKRLHSIRFIKAEVADFNAYQGGCTEMELIPFLTEAGFAERERDVFADMAGTGRYSDILFERVG